MKSPLIMDLCRDTLSLCHEGVELGSIEAGFGKDELTAGIGRLMELDRPSHTSGVRLRLHPPIVQVRTLRKIPPVTDRDLRGIVEAQHGRFFRPWGARPIVAARWVDKGQDRVVRAASVDAELLEHVERELLEHGMRLTEIRVVRDDEDLHLRLHTARLEARNRSRAVRRRLAMLGLAMAGWLVAAGVYLGDLLRDHRATMDQWAALTTPLDQLATVEAGIQDFKSVAEALSRQADAEHRLTPIIGALVTALPSEAHLHRLSIERHGPVRLRVHGSDPLQAVETLDSRWPGVVRLETGDADEALDGRTPFNVVLEAPR